MKTVVVHSQQKWEYLLSSRRSETTLAYALNEVGQQGWELVTVVQHKDAQGLPSWTAFLKRPSGGQAPKAAPLDTAAATPESGLTAAREAISPPGFDLSGDTFEIKKE